MDVKTSRNRDLRWAAGLLALTTCVGCSSFSGTTAASFLRKVEGSRDPNERYRAYANLASPRCYDDESQKTKAVQILSAKLDLKGVADGDWHEPSATRAVICRTLGKLRHPEARSAILRAVNDSDPLVRAEACRALGSVGTQEDATILARIMSADTSVDCRVAAVDGLGQLKSNDPRISTFLAQSMADDEDPAIRLAALNALRSITGKDLGVEPKPWQEYVASTIPATPTPVIVARPDAPKPARPVPSNLPAIDPTIRPAAVPR